MTDKPQNQYLKSQIMTASPERLQMMLFDGAIRFCEQARRAMDGADLAAVHDRLIRAQRIVMELATNLRRDVDPDLCDKLTGLYNYIYRLLVEANLSKETAKLDEAIELLGYQRETWALLIKKLAEQRSSGDPGDARSPASTAQAPAGKPKAPVSGSLVGGALSIEG
jgi:flagellar protein FliS